MVQLGHHGVTVKPSNFSCLALVLPTAHEPRRVLNPIVKNSLKIWSHFQNHFRFKQASGFSILTFNDLLPTSQIDTTFWHRNGLVFFCDLFVDNTFVSFDTLKVDHNIPNSHFFRYLQTGSFAKKHFHLSPLSVQLIGA